MAAAAAGFRLRATEARDLPDLMGWFPDAASTDQWSGPFLRHPFDADSFAADLRWQEVSSWSLVDEPGDMVGFGQFYQRYGRMHLARLAVSPERRGQGVGRALVDAIMRVAAEDLGLDDYGLYVYTDNDAAIRCYRAAGFRQARLPEGEVLGGRAIYMTRRRA